MATNPWLVPKTRIVDLAADSRDTTRPSSAICIGYGPSIAREMICEIREQAVSSRAEERYPGEEELFDGLTARGTAENARCDVNIRR